MTELLTAPFVATGAPARSAAASLESMRARILGETELFAEQTPAARLVQSAELFERQAMITVGESKSELYSSAFSCWQQLSLRNTDLTIPSTDRLLDQRLALAFHLAVTGTLSLRVPEARQVLLRAYPSADQIDTALQVREQSWGEAVLHDTFLAIVLLTRKGDGWNDVSLALGLLDSLRQRQSEFEDSFLERSEDPRTDAVRLVAYYHLAQMVTITGQYLKTGNGAASGVSTRLATHENQAQRAAEMLRDGDLAHLIRLVHAVADALVDHSIWSQVATVGARAREFASVLAGVDEPTLELWPSQVDALSQSFLDPYRRAVIVEMPTSAGKSLLAKLAIIQVIALNPSSTIAYIVPTRVLVNQVTEDLRRDLSKMDLVVEQAIPVFSLDPTESAMLSGDLNVLVTTPEKLDLLVRENHASLEDLSMVVVDEAHNLADTSRGARLELVLATIRRDRPSARFLLLSPFVPNGEELVEWLGDGRHLPPIHVSWRPNQRAVGELKVEKTVDPDDRRRRLHHLKFTAIDAVGNTNMPAGETLALGPVDSTTDSLGRIAAAAASRLGWRGQTLIVCNGKPTSVNRALSIADERPGRELSALGEAVIRHTYVELGPDNALAKSLRHGVAYHHAGLSLEMRRLVEQLMREQTIDTIVGTTTLAQGANFPLANVIIETRQLGHDTMSHTDFWNIAGRAGRGMMNDLGVIGFPVMTDVQRKGWEKFFEDDAQKIASQLADVVAAADAIGSKFDRDAIRTNPNLSSFLQYLAHAMHVSGSFEFANEVEDLLRSSLIFRQVERDSAENARSLVRLCRAYLDSLSSKAGLVSLADGTGFSTPTIAGVSYEINTQFSEMRDASTWVPSELFGADQRPLADRISLVAGFPEMELSDNQVGVFSPERMAKILHGWVNGAAVHDLADTFGEPKDDAITRHARFNSYLHSTLTGLASWGLGALERVALAGTNADADVLERAGHVPSMVLFGVNSPEAIWMRMTGLTREASSSASELWRAERQSTPSTFAEVRAWIGNLDDGAWDSALAGTAYSTGDMRLLWPVLRT